MPTPFRHVLCVHPYRRTGSSLTAFPPLGLEYIAAALRPYAGRIDLINFRQESTPSSRPFLRPETDLVCYSVNWQIGLESIRDDINALPAGLSIIVGGRTATDDPNYWLENCPNVSAVVCGDGEQAIVEIAQGRPWPEIAGLVYRGPDGRLMHNPPRANAPLDDNLLPARDLRRRPYFLTSKNVSMGIKIDKVAGSRGCPFNCKFCNFAINPWGVKRSWAPRSAASIVREIEQLDADLIFFVDDVFTHQPDRVLEICDLLIAKGIRKHYVVNARTEIANRPDVLARMERAGFLVLLIGVESTQDATLRSMGKGQTIEQVRQRFAVLSKSKMVTAAYFIVGNIGETEEQMLSTASFARSLGADFIFVSRLRMERHSALGELVAQSPGYHVDPDGFVYSDRYSAEHLAALRKRIDREFYTVRHVAHITRKVMRIVHRHVLTRTAIALCFYFGMVLGKLAYRPVRKWRQRRDKARQKK